MPVGPETALRWSALLTSSGGAGCFQKRNQRWGRKWKEGGVLAGGRARRRATGTCSTCDPQARAGAGVGALGAWIEPQLHWLLEVSSWSAPLSSLRLRVLIYKMDL